MRYPRVRWSFVALGVVAAALLAWFLFHKKPDAPPKPQPIPVSVAKVSLQDVPVSITALGAAQAWTSDAILAQVSGILLSVDFVEGTNVKKGSFWPRSIPRPIKRRSLRRGERSNATRRCSPARVSISRATPRWKGRIRSPGRPMGTRSPW